MKHILSLCELKCQLRDMNSAFESAIDPECGYHIIKYSSEVENKKLNTCVYFYGGQFIKLTQEVVK